MRIVATPDNGCAKSGSRLEARLQCGDDILGDLVPKFEDVFLQTVIALGPYMVAGDSVDQLAGEPVEV
jgi:hypothetical protein